MKAEKFIRTFTIVMLILVPVSYFIIAASEGKAFWIAGIMLIATVFAYAVNFSTLKKL